MLDTIGLLDTIFLQSIQYILRYLDECDPVAAEIGAVNTVVVRGNGKLQGYNTDYVGVLRALEPRIPLRGSRVLIFGAGGSARAVAFALALSPSNEIDMGDGPINVNPQLSQMEAKFAFSLKKPTPG